METSSLVMLSVRGFCVHRLLKTRVVPAVCVLVPALLLDVVRREFTWGSSAGEMVSSGGAQCEAWRLSNVGGRRCCWI